MKIKKSMILAAGYGKRMLPLTKTTPKPLIKIGSTNLLNNAIRFLEKIGIEEIIINTHYLHDKIKNYIKNENYSSKVEIITETKLLDTGGGILNATKKFKNDPFLVLNPDTLWNDNYQDELLSLQDLFFKTKKLSMLLVNKNKSFDKSFQGDFNLKNNLVSKNKINEFIFIGAQIIKRDFLIKINKEVFSMNEIWNDLVIKKEISGLESIQDFYHINSINIYNELKGRFID